MPENPDEDVKTSSPKSQRDGDRLKIRYDVTRGETSGIPYHYFNPALLSIELNGVKLNWCTGVSIDFSDAYPTATLVVNLHGIDIDMDTLTALQAFAKQNEAKKER